MNPQHLEGILASRREAGMTSDEAIGWLHTQGCSKIESIALIARTYGCDLGQTKLLVHHHPAWEFRRKSDDAFHEHLYECLSNEEGLQQIFGSLSGQEVSPEIKE